MRATSCVECGEALAVTGRGRPRRYCSRACQARAYRRRRDHGPTAPPRRPPPSSVPADADPRTRLVRLAVEIADTAGLDAVSMRALAHRAGVPTHVLHRSVRSRADLLDAMAEHVIGTQWRVRPQWTEPRNRLDRLARMEWAMYRRHPWLVTVLATSRPPTGPAVLSMVDATVEALAQAGYDDREAFAGYLALSGYVQGMALLIDAERAGPTYGTWRSATLARLERTGRMRQRPWLVAAGQIDPRKADRELDSWFDFGLRHLLDSLVPTDRPSPGPRGGVSPWLNAG